LPIFPDKYQDNLVPVTGLLIYALITTQKRKTSKKPSTISSEGLLIKLSHIPENPLFQIPDSPDAKAIITPDEAASAVPDSFRKNFLM
jgi:hypothetical protein